MLQTDLVLESVYHHPICNAPVVVKPVGSRTAMILSKIVIFEYIGHRFMIYGE